MSYYTKEERSNYERSRRAQNMEQIRDYRLMRSWMEKRHPNILNAYISFKEDLQKRNPYRVDLSKSPIFRKFLRDPIQIPTEEKTALYGAPHSAHTEMQVVLAPRSVHDATHTAIEKSVQDHAKRVAVTGEKRKAINTHSDGKEVKRQRAVNISRDGSENSKDEDNTVIKGSGQGTKAKIETDIITMMDLMSSPTFRKVGHKDS